jgi:hypothetical protein
MRKNILGFIVLFQLLDILVICWNIGIPILMFPVAPEYGFVIEIPYAAMLIISIVAAQFYLRYSVRHDFEKKVWVDVQQGHLWEKIFSLDVLYRNMMFNTIYTIMIMKDNTESNWWSTQRKKSVLFKAISEKKVLDILSKINATNLYIFLMAWVALGVGISLHVSVIIYIGALLAAFWLLAIFELATLFNLMMMAHIASRKWPDASFEDYFITRSSPSWNKLRDYYYAIARYELS